MTIAFNKNIMKERRQSLRHNMTQPEIILWSNIRRRQINGFRFRRQYSVDEYIIDFYCSELRLAIEIDGENHNLLDNKEYDLEREEKIKLYGIDFLRFSNKEVVDNIEDVVKKIYAVVKLKANQKNPFSPS